MAYDCLKELYCPAQPAVSQGAVYKTYPLMSLSHSMLLSLLSEARQNCCSYYHLINSMPQFINDIQVTFWQMLSPE